MKYVDVRQGASILGSVLVDMGATIVSSETSDDTVIVEVAHPRWTNRVIRVSLLEDGGCVVLAAAVCPIGTIDAENGEPSLVAANMYESTLRGLLVNFLMAHALRPTYRVGP